MQDHDGRALAVGLSDAEQAAVADADGVAAVESVPADEVAATVDGAPPACVAVAHDPPDADALAVATAATGEHPDLPVVVVADADEAFAADAVAAGACRYVPRDRGPDALGEATVAAVREGTRRRQAAAAAEAFDEVLRLAPLQIYVTDTEARHRLSTKMAVHPDIAGRTHAEYFDEPRARAITDITRDVLESEESCEDQLTRYEVDASDIDEIEAGWLRSWVYPWYGDEGELCGVVGFTQDVTGIEQTQAELSRTNDLLQQFASVVTHDLRNPLNVAQGNLELARETGDEEFFDAVAGGHERMAEIIEDLVRLTRDSDSEDPLSTVSLQEAATAAWETVETADATLSLDVDRALVRADEGPLQQLFENLFRNAVEHVGEDVAASVGLVDDGFYVADDGDGLNPQITEQLNAGEFNAGGLGLNIVRTIADRHGWTFTAGESEAGGARFTFTDAILIRHGTTATATREPVPIVDDVAVGDRAAGSVEQDGDSWAVTGQGRNLWRTVNEFYYVYGTVSGDADLVARVADFDAAAGKSKVGVMARAGLDEGSPHAYVGLSRDAGAETLWQLEPDAGTQSRLHEDDVWVPHWFRLTRRGDTVTTFTSPDGVAWTPVDEQVVPLGESAHYGLVVTSHVNDDAAVATFDNVDLAGVTWVE